MAFICSRSGVITGGCGRRFIGGGACRSARITETTTAWDEALWDVIAERRHGSPDEADAERPPPLVHNLPAHPRTAHCCCIEYLHTSRRGMPVR